MNNRSLASSCYAILALTAFAVHADEIQFNRDIRPILSDNCFACHGPDEKHRKGGLRLDLEESALEDRDGVKAIVPGNVDASELWRRVNAHGTEDLMPPVETNKQLSKDDLATIRKWIEQGAEFQGHWSFVAPTSSAPPSKLKHQAKIVNPIDAFVFARLEQDGLSPSNEADRQTLLRRVTLDLTGLPPTLEEIDAFVNDKSDSAYEKVVDRLLKSEHFGERMAVTWMDLARYGDTSVFHAEGPRDMWAWRDWVINSYNTNKPFDQFTVEQLAGDLLPEATVNQKMATAFLRNNGTTDEGGVIAEEYRVEYVVDRVKTTSMVWLGLSMECGQCHDHKFDPITQEEYYKFYAYFNQSADKGMQTRRGNAAPMLSIPKYESDDEVKNLETELTKLSKEIEAHKKSIEPEFQAWVDEKTLEVELEDIPLIPSDPVVYFTFDERKGNTAANTGTSKTEATIKGKTLWDSGKHDGAVKIDGSNYLDAGKKIGDFDTGDAFSFGCWVNMETGNGAIFSKMKDSNAFRGWDLWMQSNQIGTHIIHKWQDDALKVVSKNPIKLKEWTHVMVTYDGSASSKGVKIYINGKPQEFTIEADSLKGTIKTPTNLHIGRRNMSGGVKGKIDDLRIYDRVLSQADVAALAGNDLITPILKLAAKDRTPNDIEVLRDHYLANFDKAAPKFKKRRADLQAKIGDLKKPLTTVMIMTDEKNHRQTYMLNRGQYDQPMKDKPVQPGVPAMLNPLPEDAPANRLGLAKWIVDPKNPLTARVAVNRYWYMFFGTGIVKTLEELGSQGEWPSHPQLLDWLAVDFVKNGWDVKRTIKQMVMSATYRQSSRISPEVRELDPYNRLLARGPRFRLQAEFIRDQALAASGLLVPTVGGPGVKPYQPAGLWNEVSLSGNVRFKKDSGEKLFRRSLYTYWKRSAPAPTMTIFDTPSRETCTIRRPRTNTPLQALVTLNDPQFVEASRAMAERTIKEAGTTPEERIEYMFRLSTGRKPKTSVVEALLDAYQQELDTFVNDKDRATKLLSIGDSKRDESIDIAEHAAWSIISSMILNLDATLTRG